MTRQQSLQFKLELLKLFILSAILLSALFVQCVSMAGAAETTTEATAADPHEICIQTQKFDHYFKGEQSRMSTFIVAKATYGHAGQPAKDYKRYKAFFFAPSQCIGSRKFSNFDLPPGDEVRIKYQPVEPGVSKDESYAAAGAIVRLVLDAQINRNPVSAVSVPLSLFDSVLFALRSHGFATKNSAPESFCEGNIFVPIASEPAGRIETVFHK